MKVPGVLTVLEQHSGSIAKKGVGGFLCQVEQVGLEAILQVT